MQVEQIEKKTTFSFLPLKSKKTTFAASIEEPLPIGRPLSPRRLLHFRISQGTAATFLGCGGQDRKRWRRIPRGPKLIQIGWALTELFAKTPPATRQD